MNFERTKISILRQRLSEPPQFMIVVAGPRQVGKTTMVRHALADCPSTFVATDQSVSELDGLLMPDADTSLSFRVTPGAAVDAEWLVQQWQRARNRARAQQGEKSYVLAIDEIQKVPRWSEVVKDLWDADRAEGVHLHIVLLGSSPWLMQKGLTESLAGRYELIPMTHWSMAEKPPRYLSTCLRTVG